MSWSSIIDALESFLLPCGIRSLTGVPCPGCGMQTALVALLRGDLAASIEANPGLIPLLATLVYTALHLRFSYAAGPKNVLLLFCFTVSLMIANYVVRSGLFG